MPFRQAMQRLQSNGTSARTKKTGGTVVWTLGTCFILDLSLLVPPCPLDDSESLTRRQNTEPLCSDKKILSPLVLPARKDDR